MQYLVPASASSGPTCVVKLVSVAPRTRRLNSSSLPRLRSHPIHTCSRSFHCRSRWKRKNFGPGLAAGARVEVFDRGSRRREDALRRRRRRASWHRRSRRGSRSESADRDSRSQSLRDVRPARRRRPTLVSSVGMTTMVLDSSGTPSESSSRGSGSGCTRRLDQLLHEGDRELAGGNQDEQRGERPASRLMRRRSTHRRAPPPAAAPWSSTRSRSGRPRVACARTSRRRRGFNFGR